MTATPIIPITLDAFDRCEIPLAQWNHRAHLAVAYLLLRAFPLAEATQSMQRGVQKYNAANNIEQTETGGYHDTLTIAWMRILHATIAVYDPADGPDSFLDQHTQLHSRVLLRLFYSRPRIMSWEARRGWVEPDLAPLPTPPPAPRGFPVITTPRLILRRGELSDADTIQSLLSDRDVAINLGSVPHPYPPGTALDFILKSHANFANNISLSLYIERQDTPGIIGGVGFKLSPEHQRAELGYWLGKPFWGNGYATEAARAMCEYGFNTLGLTRIHAYYFHWNPASGTVLEKLGMAREGVQPHHFLRLGQWADDVMMGMNKEAFLPSPTGGGAGGGVGGPR